MNIKNLLKSMMENMKKEEKETGKTEREIRIEDHTYCIRYNSRWYEIPVMTINGNNRPTFMYHENERMTGDYRDYLDVFLYIDDAYNTSFEQRQWEQQQQNAKTSEAFQRLQRMFYGKPVCHLYASIADETYSLIVSYPTPQEHPLYTLTLVHHETEQTYVGEQFSCIYSQPLLFDSFIQTAAILSSVELEQWMTSGYIHLTEKEKTNQREHKIQELIEQLNDYKLLQRLFDDSSYHEQIQTIQDTLKLYSKSS